jgi:hypothetical protein
MSDKPSYLKVLNAIAVGEACGHALFDAWAKATRDAELADTLNGRNPWYEREPCSAQRSVSCAMAF